MASRKKRELNDPVQWYEWVALLSIIVITVIVFSNSLSGNFLSLDDTEYVHDNPFIRSLSPGSIKNIFTSFYNGNYHPLTTLLYAIEFKLFHLNAWPYHFLNLFIHLGNVLLVFFLIKNISGKINVALIVALLFGIHPMHVESVAWISELKNVLYTFFYLAGLIVYLRYLQKREPRLLILTGLFFLLSLLSKSAAITFPLILLLLDYYKERKWNKKILLEKIPFGLLSLAFVIITILSQQSGGAMDSGQMPHYTIVQRFFVVNYALIFYVVKMFVPVNLSAMHYAPAQFPYYYYPAPLATAFIAWLVIKAGVMKKQIVFGLLFYLFSIILVVQIIPVGATIVSERYSYIPYIGLFFIAGSFYSLIIEKKVPAAAFIRPYFRYIIATAVLFFCVLSYQRIKVWHDDTALFTDIAKKNPSSANAQLALANVLSGSGNYPLALVKYDESVALDSTVAETYFNRGNIYYQQKDYTKALADYLEATRLKAGYAEAFFNIGTVYAESGNVEKSIDYFNRSISIQPNEYMYNSRATAYYFLKKYEEAIEDYTHALSINPSLVDVYFNRGLAYNALNKSKEACSDWKTALSMGHQKAGEVLNLYCR